MKKKNSNLVSISIENQPTFYWYFKKRIQKSAGHIFVKFFRHHKVQIQNPAAK